MTPPTSLWLDGFELGVTDHLRPGERFDDVVVGAGLTGLSTAVLLARGGRRVAVVEARHRGAVTTGNTTAKLSLLHGTKLSQLRAHHSARIALAYVEANREGRDWLLDFCRTAGVPVEMRDAVNFAMTPGGVDVLDREVDACREAGLPVERSDRADLPLPTYGAVTLRDQHQFDPMDVIEALASELERLGGRIHENTTVMDVTVEGDCTVVTTAGDILAENVILATGIPFLDRGLYFSKVAAKRSYALAFDVPEASIAGLPKGMYLSVDGPGRSVRTTPTHGATRLVIGGNGHDVGRAASPAELVDDLERWTHEHFPGARRTHAWSAQDYSPHNHIPFVGLLPRGGGRIYVATGFDKWGMSNGPAAALRITAEIFGATLDWAAVLGTRMTVPADLAEGAIEGVKVAGETIKGWVTAERTAVDDAHPAEGEGIVGRRGLAPVGVSRVDGRECAVSAVCPHLGGVVTWNDAELSWDCPLHGSRFAADGTRLEGPATRGLDSVAD